MKRSIRQEVPKLKRSKCSHAIFITVRQSFPIQNNANVGSNAFTGTVMGSGRPPWAAGEFSNIRDLSLLTGRGNVGCPKICDSGPILMLIKPICLYGIQIGLISIKIGPLSHISGHPRETGRNCQNVDREAGK